MAQTPNLPTFDRQIVRGSIHSAVWKIAWPTMLTNLVAGLQGVVDHAMVGHFVGYLGNAAIGVSWQIFIVIVVLVSSLHTGMGVLVTRFAGAGEERKVDRVVYQAFLVSTFLGLAVFAPVGYVLSPWMLTLVNATPEVQAEALPYLRALFLCSLGLLYFFLLGGAMRAAGDARTPMRIGLVMTGSNLVLTVILVRGLGVIPSLGTAGAGIATVVSGGVASALGFYLILSGQAVVKLAKGSSRRPNWKIIRALLRFGLPTGFQGIVMNIGAVFLIRYVGALEASAEAQAAYTVAYGQLFSLINWASVAVMAATATVAGQNLGAQKPDRSARAPISASVVGLGVTVPLGLLFVLVPRPLLSVFGMDNPRALVLGEQLLGFLAVSSVFMTIAYCYTGALQGTGDTRNPMIIAILSQVVLPLSFCALFDRTMGLEPSTIWLAIVLGHFARCVLSIGVFRQGKWRDIKLDLGEGFSSQGIPRPNPSQIVQRSAILKRSENSIGDRDPQNGDSEP